MLALKMKEIFVMLSIVAASASAQAQRAEIARSDWSPGSSSIEEAEIVPPAYRGEWAPNAADCKDQDGIRTVSVSTYGVETYESGGRLQRITSMGQNRSVKLKLAYEGEGDFWDAIEIWTLSEQGDRLVMSDEKGASPTTLIKCD